MSEQLELFKKRKELDWWKGFATGVFTTFILFLIYDILLIVLDNAP